MTVTDDPEQPEPTAANPAARQESTKALTLVLPETLLRRLRVIAVLKNKSVSEIVCEHIDVIVKRDLRKLIGKLDL